MVLLPAVGIPRSGWRARAGGMRGTGERGKGERGEGEEGRGVKSTAIIYKAVSCSVDPSKSVPEIQWLAKHSWFRSGESWQGQKPKISSFFYANWIVKILPRKPEVYVRKW